MNENQSQIATRYESWLLNRADAKMKEALSEFTVALQAGVIQLDNAVAPTPNYAGGVNYCPNSDLKFSKEAINNTSSTPATPGDANFECYRWYRQIKDDPIVEDTAHALQAEGHSLFTGAEYATHADKVNVTETPGSTIEKTAGVDGTFDAGSHSTQSVASGQIKGECILPSAAEQGILGINTVADADDDVGMTNIKYGIYADSGGLFAVESGVVIDLTTSYTTGDKMSVEVTTIGTVVYRKNSGASLRTVAVPILSYPLCIDYSIAKTGGKLVNCQVKTGEAAPAIPVWNRVDGWAIGGSEGVTLYDLAVKLYGNDIKPADKWYVRIALQANAVDLVPADLQMYCGFWHKKGSGEGWIEGGNFDLAYSVIGVKGTQAINYLVVAKTDTGIVIQSQILSVLDAPNVLDAQNFVRLNFAGAVGSGYIQFEVYREYVAGQTHKIADLRNTNTLLYDDIGTNIIQTSALPAITSPIALAIANSTRLTIGIQGGAFVVNDFTIRVPSNYDWSETLPFSQYLRFGFTVETAVNRQINIDKIWLSPAYAIWADSPQDLASGSTASTSQTGAPPVSGGTNPTPPETGGGGYGGGCILFKVPVLRIGFDKQFEWLPYKDIPRGDVLENGTKKPNLVLEKHADSIIFEYYKMVFDNGATLLIAPRHKIRINARGDYLPALAFKKGSVAFGWRDGISEGTKLVSKRLVKVKKGKRAGTFTTNGDECFICGISENNSGIYIHNLKDEYGYEYGYF